MVEFSFFPNWFIRVCTRLYAEEKDQKSLFVLPKRDSAMEERVLIERKDGWLEIQLGELYNDGSGKEVKMSLKRSEGRASQTSKRP